MEGVHCFTGACTETTDSVSGSAADSRQAGAHKLRSEWTNPALGEQPAPSRRVRARSENNKHQTRRLAFATRTLT